MPYKSKHPVVEVIHTTAKTVKAGVDPVDNVTHTIRAIAASEAFRKYDWLNKVAVKNASGNLRGMVVSARWRTVDTVIGTYAERAGNLAFFAGVVMNAAGEIAARRRRLGVHNHRQGTRRRQHVSCDHGNGHADRQSANAIAFDNGLSPR